MKFDSFSENVFLNHNLWIAPFGEQISKFFLSRHKLKFKIVPVICFHAQENRIYYVLCFDKLRFRKNNPFKTQFAHPIFAHIADAKIKRNYSIFISVILKRKRIVRTTAGFRFAVMVREINSNVKSELDKYCIENDVRLLEESDYESVLRPVLEV